MNMLRELFAKPIAHRGLHDAQKGIVENSLPAFSAAIDKGFAIECDIQLSGDGKPMVFHDYDLKRLCNQDSAVNTMTAAQLGQIKLTGSDDAIPDFKAFLDLVAGRAALFVELKDQLDGRNPLIAEVTAKMVATYSGPICFISFSPEVLINLRRSGFKGPIGIILDRYQSPWAKENLSAWRRFNLTNLLHYPRTRFDFVDCGKDDLDLPAVRFFRKLGFPTATWTIRSQQQADIALRHCDQITFEGFLPD